MAIEHDYGLWYYYYGLLTKNTIMPLNPYYTVLIIIIMAMMSKKYDNLIQQKGSCSKKEKHVALAMMSNWSKLVGPLLFKLGLIHA